MTDDLNAWSGIQRTVREERRARLAGALSVAAICMLLITNVTVANRGALFAAPQALSPTFLPPKPAEAASFTMTASECGAAMAAMMAGGKFIWTEPHTGHDLVAASDVHILSRKQ